MRISLKSCLFLLPVLVVSLFVCLVSSAFAQSPWWHLGSGSRPSFFGAGRRGLCCGDGDEFG